MLLDPNFKSLDPKIVVEFEPEERGREDFISKGDLVDVQYNSFCAHLLAFNLKEKMPIFNNYVKEVMSPDNELEAKEKAVQELDKMICEDTRLADYLEVDVVDQLAMMLQERVTYSTTFNHSLAYVLSRAKIDTCYVIIKEKAIPTLMTFLMLRNSLSPKDALPIIITLTRFARVSPKYVRDMLNKGSFFNWLEHYLCYTAKGTSMIDNLAKFMVAICQTNVLSDSENFFCCKLVGIILSMKLGTSFHEEIACYALQYLSYERPTAISDKTIFILTKLSRKQNITVSVSALGVLGNIMRWGFDWQIKLLVEARDPVFIRCLQRSLSDSKPMKFQWEVCLIISTIADHRPTFAQIAIEQFRNHTRKLVGESISAALRKLKSRTGERPTSQPEAIEVLNKILEFNALLIALKKHPRTRSFARGLGSISFLDGGYDGDRKMDDLELLYRTYLTDYLFNGRIEEDKLAALNQLRKLFGLGEREVESITLDVTSKEYRYRLDQSIISGRLEAAKNKEDFLQNLCEELNFNAQKAVEIHEEIYRRKLHQFVSNGELSDKDAKSLKRTQIMLCIPEQTVESAHTDFMQ